LSLLVRTWNVYHGRTSPPSRRLHLEEAVRLVTQDAPDIVALQEVPPWALPGLTAWSGMRAYGEQTKRSLLGPLAQFLQRLDPIHVRSGLTGQANVLLIGPRLELVSSGDSLVLNPGSRRERRIYQAVRIRVAGRPILIGHFHATNGDTRSARAEINRVGELVEAEGSCIILGDFNVPGTGLPGFSHPLPGIDQILARGLELVEGPSPWPNERRRSRGWLVSDHAPVEAVVR
jgi:endonuclease/exonuclease/phosphatase family metal-dependent hydrolase